MLSARSYGTEKCATVPGVYADAFNLGLQASREAIKKAEQRKQDRCLKKSLSNHKKRITKNSKRTVKDVGFDLRQPSGVAKKLGGIDAAGLNETLRFSGCTNNSECVSNVCRPVELCNGNETLSKIDNSNYREALEFEVMQRPVKPINETEAGQQQEKQTVRLQTCSSFDICWLSAWVNAYSPAAIPVFDLKAVSESEDEENVSV